MLMSWPGGLGTELYLQGRARDLHTPTEGAPTVVAQADLTVLTGRERDIQSIEADPDVAGLERLLRVRAGSGLRAAIAAELPGEVEGGTPLYLLLDDLGGATLIAGYTYFRWADVFPEMRSRIENGPQRVMQGTCSGFREGSIALKSDGTLSHVRQNTARTASLVDPADPLGWHELQEHPVMGMRRARRIDVWANGDLLEIDAWFRDSVWVPEGHEEAIHEYQILGTADRSTGTLLSVRAVPRAALRRMPRGGTERGADGGNGLAHHARGGTPTDPCHRLLHTPERRAALARRGPDTRGRVARLSRP